MGGDTKKWIEGNLKKAKKLFWRGNKNFAKRILKNLSENKGIEEATEMLKEIEELEKNEGNDSWFDPLSLDQSHLFKAHCLKKYKGKLNNLQLS